MASCMRDHTIRYFPLSQVRDLREGAERGVRRRQGPAPPGAVKRP